MSAISLIGPIGFLTGTTYIIDAFLVVIFGGIGKLRGAVIAAIVLGLVSSFSEYSTTASIGKAITLGFVILFLQFRRTGSSRSARGASPLEHHLDPHGPTTSVPAVPDTAVVPVEPTGLVQRAKARALRSGPVVLGFAAFAIVLDRWPQYLGDPTRIRQWAEYL